MPDEADEPIADPPAEERNPFEGTVGRHSVDYLLRNSHDGLVALSGQADVKASVMITASSIILSVSASQIDDHDLRWPARVLLAFILLALLTSVLAVFPKFSRHKAGSNELPPDFNPLFFGHYSGISKDTFLDYMADVVRDDAKIYLSLSVDIYEQGVYLVRAKYRFLRLSYSFFLSGFLVAAVVLLATAL